MRDLHWSIFRLLICVLHMDVPSSINKSRIYIFSDFIRQNHKLQHHEAALFLFCWVRAASEPAVLNTVPPAVLSIDHKVNISDQITHRYWEDKSIWLHDWKGSSTTLDKLPHTEPKCPFPHIPHHLSGSAHLVIGGCGWLVLIGYRQWEV